MIERTFNFNEWVVELTVDDPQTTAGQVGMVTVSGDTLLLTAKVTNPAGKTFTFHEELWAGDFPPSLLEKVRVGAIPSNSAAAYYDGWEKGIEIYLGNASLYVFIDGSTVWED